MLTRQCDVYSIWRNCWQIFDITQNENEEAQEEDQERAEEEKSDEEKEEDEEEREKKNEGAEEHERIAEEEMEEENDNRRILSKKTPHVVAVQTINPVRLKVTFNSQLILWRTRIISF